MKAPFRPMVSAIVFLTLTLAFAFTCKAMGGFSVVPLLPEIQNPESEGFFNLRVSAGAEHVFYVEVYATDEVDSTVEIMLTTAGTNWNGRVDYSPRDDGVIRAFEQIASIPPQYREMTVPGGSSVLVPITLNIPEGGFHGVVLGAVFVRHALPIEGSANSIIPVLLSVNDDPVYIAFSLGFVRAEPIGDSNLVIANINHHNPRITRDVDISARIYQVGSDTPILTTSSTGVEFAPISAYPLIFWEGWGLADGNFRAVVQLERHGRVWDFETGFAVGEAGNAAALPWVVVVAVVVVAVGAAGIVTVVIMKNRKKHQMELDARLAQAKERRDAFQASLTED